ncbi:hypothetical protein GAYE_SCF67G6879 [Galdieria yellowstonensis]|uniref:Uncharacterized protein n=1 Tax=Galdieria yellowstonensis TaxID=3028027 RepID=A0AAV9IND3_9RHOD|nr:hypothetical protein GAYE_SCF67G6879 [Galdieria yellowstonensis]
MQGWKKPVITDAFGNRVTYVLKRYFNAPTTGEELPHSLGGHVTDADTLLRHKGLGEETAYFLKEDARKFEKLAKQLKSALNSGKLMTKEQLKVAMEQRGIQVSEEGLEDLLRLKEHIRFSDASSSGT